MIQLLSSRSGSGDLTTLRLDVRIFDGFPLAVVSLFYLFAHPSLFSIYEACIYGFVPSALPLFVRIYASPVVGVSPHGMLVKSLLSSHFWPLRQLVRRNLSFPCLVSPVA